VRTSTLARRLRRDDRADDGFGLVEVMVALAIAVFVFSATATLLVGTAKATLLARQNQQSADVLNEQVEQIRSLPYAATTMSTADPTLTQSQDPNLTTVGGNLAFNPGSGAELLALAPVGAINPHTYTVTRNKTTYTVSRYVTCPAESGATCVGGTGVQDRRATVIVTWVTHGATHTRKSSTILTETRRGLPLPYFRFGRSQTVNANIGGPIQIPVFVTNLGARDEWDLSTGAGSWTWWWDKNGNGQLEPATDVQLTGNPSYDTNGNGVPDSGLIDSGVTLKFFAVRTATIADIGNTTVSLRATSVAQPTATTATQTFTDTISTSPDYCPGCTSTKLYLHNATPTKVYTGGTTQTPQNTKLLGMNISAPTYSGSLANYSTDITGSSFGRFLNHEVATDNATTVTDQTKVAVWQRQMQNACSLPAGSYAAVTLYGLPATGFSGGFAIYIGSDTNGQLGNFNVAGSQTFASSTWGTTFNSFTVSIPITSAFALAKNDYLEVRVLAPATSGNMNIAYDTTTYASYVSMPLLGASCV